MTRASGGHAHANRPSKSRIPNGSKVRRIEGLLLVLLVIAGACSKESTSLHSPDASGSIALTSPAFEDGDPIPSRYTCEGADQSPPLRWEAPRGASSYALTLIDPDAPGGSFVHWVVWDIPARTKQLDEGAAPQGAIQGTNNAGKTAYTGPCPPEGDSPHRYVFTIYAVKSGATDELSAGDSADALLDALECCVLAKGSLTGSFGRP